MLYRKTAHRYAPSIYLTASEITNPVNTRTSPVRRRWWYINPKKLFGDWSVYFLSIHWSQFSVYVSKTEGANEGSSSWGCSLSPFENRTRTPQFKSFASWSKSLMSLVYCGSGPLNYGPIFSNCNLCPELRKIRTAHCISVDTHSVHWSGKVPTPSWTVKWAFTTRTYHLTIKVIGKVPDSYSFQLKLFFATHAMLFSGWSNCQDWFFTALHEENIRSAIALDFSCNTQNNPPKNVGVTNARHLCIVSLRWLLIFFKTSAPSAFHVCTQFLSKDGW